MAGTFFGKRALKPIRLAVAVALLLTVMPWTALADNVQNDVTAGGNDTFSAGSSTLVAYRIAANNGDGQTGCNASDGTPATVTINVPAGVSVTPGTRTFSSCGTFQSVTFSSSTPGNYSINVSVSDSGTGSYNVNPATFTLHVTTPPDTTPPVVTPNVAGTLGSNDWYVSDVTLSWTVTDGQSAITSQSGCGTTTITTDTTGTVYTCSATSAGGTTNQSITIKRDATKPTLSSALTNVLAEATGPGGATVSFSDPNFTDATSQVASVSCAPASGSNFSLGTVAVNCAATDNAGNVSDPATFNVTVQDTTSPQIAPALDIDNVEAAGPSGAVVTYTPPTATDLVSGNVPVNCSPASGSTFSLGSTSVNCSATDAAGNPATSSFNVTVVDTTGPMLALPGSITEEATGPAGASVTYTASAEDVVDGSVPVSCTPASDSTFPLGSTTVNCSATDAVGNTSTGSFSVTVQDTTPPALSLPADIVAEATGASGASVIYAASATDLVSGSVAVTCSPVSGGTFPLGTTTVNCSATDAAGNPANGSFTVKVQDTTPPALTVPADITTEATGPSGATVNFVATATDAVDASPTVSCSPASGSTFAIVATTVTCMATDDAGNQSSGSFTVMVRDTTPPVIEPRANITGVEATGPGGASVIFFSPNASDIVDGSLSTTCTPASGATFPLGTTTVTCSVTDAHGNSASSTFTVQVVDTTAPTLTDLDPTISPDGTNGWYKNAVLNQFRAADLVGFTGHTNPYDFTQSSGTTEGNAVTIASGPVSDAAGNTNPGINSAAFKIDLSNPTNVQFVGGPAAGGSYYFSSVPAAPTCTASDAISGLASCVVTGYSTAVGPHTMTATATDNAGRTATAQRSYSVLAWTITGFYQPVDMGIMNNARGGSTVPLKFEVFAGPTELTSTSVVQTFVQQIGCSGGGGDDIEQYATGGTSLRYDTTGGQFIFNWQTPRSPGACYRVTMTTQDGSSISADFKLR